MKPLRNWFGRNVAAALDDAHLGRAVSSTAAKKIVARSLAIENLDRADAMRELAARVKQHTIENLDHYLDRFTEAAERVGSVVHVVETPHSVNECVTQIARENEVTSCVKVKSMLSEETGMNRALADAGVGVVETDLGEFVVQLDDDRPSHIVTPIIHKNRKDIARAFSRELGVEYTEDPLTLTMHARRHLREAFQTCDMGISGVNFAVAETGTICLCTNEGNGRLSTTRPRVHVAVMGIEKLIPRAADLPLFLKLLARSSTGQPMTVYTSLLTGPRRDDEPDGPEQLHIVVLGGRRRVLARGEYSEVLRCIRCGACLNACPVFRRIGGHAYDNVYPGPIGKLLAPLLNNFDRYADLPQASSLCGMCLEVCPVQIDIPDVLVRLRRDQQHRGTIPWVRRVAFRWLSRILGTKWTYRAGQRLARWATTPWARGDWIPRLPGPLAGVTTFRDIPRPAAKPFRVLWSREALRDDRSVHTEEQPSQR